MLQISGAGVLEIFATGSIHFDSTGLAASDISLLAGESIELSGSPLGIPPSAVTGTLELLDVDGLSGLSVDDDLWIGGLKWIGSVSLTAGESIFGSGPLSASGPISLRAATTIRINTAIQGGITGAPRCETESGSGAIVMSSSSMIIRDLSASPIVGERSGCRETPLSGLHLTGITPHDGPRLEPAVPEPTAALLFCAGVLALVSGSRKRAESASLGMAWR